MKLSKKITADLSDGATNKGMGSSAPLEERSHTPTLAQHLLVNVHILGEAQYMMDF